MNDSSQKKPGLRTDSEPDVVLYMREPPRQVRLHGGFRIEEFDNALRSAPIIEPKDGDQLVGRFVAQKVPHRGAHYMVIDTSGGEVAAKVSVEINVDFVQPPLIRLDGVAVERHNRPIETAWMYFSSLNGKLWLPSSQQISQFTEYRTEPASRWIAEIETLLPELQAERKVIEDRCSECWCKLDLTNLIDDRPLTPELAMIHAKMNKFGDEYCTIIPAILNPELVWKKETLPALRAVYDRFEKIVAEKPQLRQDLEKYAAALLQEDVAFRKELAEGKSNIRAIDEALKEAPELIERLHPLGQTPVTMERFTVRRYGRHQIPMPMGELPPAQKTNQSLRRRMKM